MKSDLICQLGCKASNSSPAFEVGASECCILFLIVWRARLWLSMSDLALLLFTGVVWTHISFWQDLVGCLLLWGGTNVDLLSAGGDVYLAGLHLGERCLV